MSEGTLMGGQDAPAAEVNPVVTPTPDQFTPHQKFLETLPEDVRGNKVFQNFQSVEDLAKSYINAATMVGMDKGAVLRIPQEDTPEAWNEVYNKIGRPETADGYDLKEFDESPYLDKAVLPKVKDIAHKHGVRGDALKSLVALVNEDMQAKTDLAEQKMVETRDTYQGKIKADFGEAYDAKLGQIRQVTQNLVGTIPELADFIKEYPIASEHPGLIKVFAHYAAQTMEDTGSINGGSTMTGPLTPAEAQARLSVYQPGGEHYKVMMDPNHPQRAHHLAQKSKLYQYAYPNSQNKQW